MLIRPPPRLTNRTLVTKYVEVDLWTWLKEFSVAFLKVNFKENFQSFIVENLSIPSGQEVGIPNGFKNRYPGNIPTGRIITRQQGDANIIDGITPWNADLVFLRNPSQNDATVNVLFFS